MANIQALGAGLLLRADNLKIPVLSDAFNVLVAQSSYSASARNLAKEFSKYDSAALLSEVIFELSHSERQRRINTIAFASR